MPSKDNLPNILKEKLCSVLEQQIFPYDPTQRGLGGTQAAGRMLERELGLEDANNYSGSDFRWGEAKFTDTKAPFNLCHLEPEPELSIYGLLDAYGYSRNGGTSFYHTVHHTIHKPSRRGFYVVHEPDWDNKSGRIIMRNDANLAPEPYWSEEAILNAMNKNKRVIVSIGRRGSSVVYYDAALILTGFKHKEILPRIADGSIVIDFGVTHHDGVPRTSRGTKFRCKLSDFPKFWRSIEVFEPKRFSRFGSLTRRIKEWGLI